jgi:hypothetical protein
MLAFWPKTGDGREPDRRGGTVGGIGRNECITRLGPRSVRPRVAPERKSALLPAVSAAFRCRWVSPGVCPSNVSGGPCGPPSPLGGGRNPPPARAGDRSQSEAGQRDENRRSEGDLPSQTPRNLVAVHLPSASRSEVTKTAAGSSGAEEGRSGVASEERERVSLQLPGPDLLAFAGSRPGSCRVSGTRAPRPDSLPGGRRGAPWSNRCPGSRRRPPPGCDRSISSFSLRTDNFCRFPFRLADPLWRSRSRPSPQVIAV